MDPRHFSFFDLDPSGLKIYKKEGQLMRKLKKTPPDRLNKFRPKIK